MPTTVKVFAVFQKQDKAQQHQLAQKIVYGLNNLEAQKHNLLFTYDKARNIVLKNKEGILQLRSHLIYMPFSADYKYLVIYFSNNKRTKLERETETLLPYFLRMHLALFPVNFKETLNQPFAGMRAITQQILARFFSKPFQEELKFNTLGMAMYSVEGESCLGCAFWGNNQDAIMATETFLPSEMHHFKAYLELSLIFSNTEDQKPLPLVIHLYNDYSKEKDQELNEIFKSLELPVPVYLIKISPCHQAVNWAFHATDPTLIPENGTWIPFKTIPFSSF